MKSGRPDPQAPAPGLGFAALFPRLLAAYGAQHWWPADGPFEVMVGAVLTQNTAWANVERAIARLREAGALNAQAIVATSADDLAERLRPAGYFNVKAARLRSLCEWFLTAGGFEALRRRDSATLRRDLLAVPGVGLETADDILLYAFDRPVFVIDAYTRRILSRLGLIRGDEGYEGLRRTLEQALPSDPGLYNEYHALLVRHGKEVCRTRPRCERCVLAAECPWTVAPPA